MRFNDRELLKVAEGTPVIEGILQYMKPQGTDWSDWYQQPVFKERIFKLVNNLLFYFRINETEEPLGILVLENMQVAYENQAPAAFAFSLMFSDGKHVFACRCQDDLNKWVTALKAASYQYWRSLYTILQTKISMKTGTDPVLNYVRNKQISDNHSQEIISRQMSRSTFYNYSEKTVITTSSTSSSSAVVVENLIDL